MGLLKAIRWLSDMGMSNAIFELDCNLVVDRINSFDIDFSKIGTAYVSLKEIHHIPSCIFQVMINEIP
ncbi:hypothetical protein JHK82_015139 [Glycine max]|uniref:RNase H type-1 domain-containing protein n=2 Tax=Glycine subgen. Soja TaxID=1462606 RepID=A0A0R0JMH6_SOYBN|nr:hypothetical protein JHK87_015059 [Glycine soja]KAG5031535.1 hypothetical protein JHK85_015517 [Glycine max]KAG5045753.1 hypothetical protein JHK86_015159 [Glycine max]KAG5148258.1 hypothetical protein JHK82_015139 [Glycine max]KAH1125610.1 hypothetical protein GYH30_014943 [Glycine max]